MLFLITRVSNGLLHVGDFVALYNSSSQLNNSFTNFFAILPGLYEHSLYISNFKEFMNVEAEGSANEEIGISINSIEVNNINYSYNANKQVLFDINFKILKGQKVAFVGPNGAGKSTLVKLLLNLYSQNSGNIQINGKSIKDYSRKSIMDKIGVIFQDSQIFALSVAENVLMRPINNVKEDSEIVKNSLNLVGMYDKINSLKCGMMTKPTREMDPDGTIFSGGEQQKIIFSRIFSREYEVLVLDEPSSAMDGFSEMDLFSKVMRIYNDKIIILISHTLSNVVNCDMIFFMEEGRIIEMGNHKELMVKNGRYAQLFTAQAKGYL